MSTSTIVLFIFIGGAFFYIVTIYNTLVELKTRYLNGFTQIETQLKRQYNLIPNFLETTKAYLCDEQNMFNSIVNARNTAVSTLQKTAQNLDNANSIHELAKTQNLLQNTLTQLTTSITNHSELETNETMRQLMQELSLTEKNISFARQGFNEAANQYNAYRLSIPVIYFASWFKHTNNVQALEHKEHTEIQSHPKTSH